MLGVLWHVADNDEAYGLVGRLLDAVPAGSHLAIAHPTIEVTGERMARAIEHWNEFGKPPGIHRTPAEIEGFFDGLELVPPGIVSCTRWRPEASPFGEPAEMDQFCGVGRKP